MRVFLALLIFAIGFSGYSAAAHAFGKDSCDPAMKAQMIDHDMVMSDCLGHQDDAAEKKSDSSKTSKANCMECTHCCASHAIALLGGSSISFEPQAAVLNTPLVTAFKSDCRSSLLRPPKSLI